MVKPTGKLKFAFETITYLESKIDQLEQESKELKESVEILKRNLGRIPLDKWFEYGLDPIKELQALPEPPKEGK